MASSNSATNPGGPLPSREYEDFWVWQQLRKLFHKYYEFGYATKREAIFKALSAVQFRPEAARTPPQQPVTSGLVAQLDRYMKSNEDVPPEFAEILRLFGEGSFSEEVRVKLVNGGWNPNKVHDPALSSQDRRLPAVGSGSGAVAPAAAVSTTGIMAGQAAEPEAGQERPIIPRISGKKIVNNIDNHRIDVEDVLVMVQTVTNRLTVLQTELRDEGRQLRTDLRKQTQSRVAAMALPQPRGSAFEVDVPSFADDTDDDNDDDGDYGGQSMSVHQGPDKTITLQQE